MSWFTLTSLRPLPWFAGFIFKGLNVVVVRAGFIDIV
jgi:hypothetical protein